MEYKFIDGSVTAPIGFMAAGVHCGIRKNKDKKDLALIYSEKPCAAAAVYTQNLVKGAPVVVTKYNINHGRAQAVICNSGNANTCNADGIEKAKEMCKIVADPLGIIHEDVIVMNTRSYEAALKSIERIAHPGTAILEAKQKILFHLGTRCV